MVSSRLVALAGLTGGLSVAKWTLSACMAAWDTNPDACDGDPLTMPAGESVEVEASDGARLRGIDCGQGPAILAVHGWTEHRGYWAPVARRLVRSGFRVIAVDQRGHGNSARGTAPYRPETLGDDVRVWLEALDLGDVVVAGHSMGGLAAMALAVEHPTVVQQRVRALVLVAALASPPRDPRLPELDFDLSRLLPVVERFLGLRNYGLLALTRLFGPAPARSQMEATRAGFVGTDPATRTEAARMLTSFDLRPALAGISVPTVVIAGAHDRLTFLPWSEEIADLIPGARLHVLDGGHMLGFECPDEIVAHLVDAARPITV